MPALSTQMGALVGCFHVGSTYSGHIFKPAGPMREKKEKEKKRGTYLWAHHICLHCPHFCARNGAGKASGSGVSEKKKLLGRKRQTSAHAHSPAFSHVSVV